ncbi:hypothetical protein ACI2KS_23025 [Pseudomonas sp. NPDC087358]|uniref:hypothetical protein n=1 Tax=Pseudomonas sp. NPDC087358 TaxID=3364439 RepID=UPI003851573A
MPKIPRLFFAGLCTALASHYASADDLLFKTYAHDSPITSYSSAQGYYDCTEDIGAKALCLNDVRFIDNSFTAILVFSADKLISVSLRASFDQNLYGKAIGALAQSFTLVTLADNKSQLDVVELGAKSSNKSDYATALTNYESVGLNSGNLTYTFMEKSIPTAGHKSFVSALAAAPNNVRAAELMLVSDGASNNMMIRFSLPKLEANKVLSEVKKPVEKF